MHGLTVEKLNKTLMAMLAAKGKGLLSTQLELIQINLDVWEGIDVCLKTISRALHNSQAMGMIRVKVVPNRTDNGRWSGRRLLIWATSRLYAYARLALHRLRRFLHITERTKMSVEPILKHKVLSVKSCTVPKYILSDPTERRDPAFEEHFRAFKDYLGRL